LKLHSGHDRLGAPAELVGAGTVDLAIDLTIGLGVGSLVTDLMPAAGPGVGRAETLTFWPHVLQPIFHLLTASAVLVIDKQLGTSLLEADSSEPEPPNHTATADYLLTTI
jgi:hypothetical protein